MVAVLQWRYASQKMLRAIRVVLARIHQPLVLLTIQVAMHVHRANIQIALPEQTTAYLAGKIHTKIFHKEHSAKHATR